jgi:hypothetical protein
MIVKSIIDGRYINIPKQETKSYYEKIVFSQYGVSLGVPKQNQVCLIQSNIDALYHHKTNKP